MTRERIGSTRVSLTPVAPHERQARRRDAPECRPLGCSLEFAELHPKRASLTLPLGATISDYSILGCAVLYCARPQTSGGGWPLQSYTQLFDGYASASRSPPALHAGPGLQCSGVCASGDVLQAKNWPPLVPGASELLKVSSWLVCRMKGPPSSQLSYQLPMALNHWPSKLRLGLPRLFAYCMPFR